MRTLNPPKPTRRWQIPATDPSERWISGTAAAVAKELGVEATIVRVSFGLLVLAGGWGLILYAAAWVLITFFQPKDRIHYVPAPKAATSIHCHLAIAMVVLGTLLGLRTLGVGFVDEVVIPVGFVFLGFLVAWTRQSEDGGISAIVRIGAGVMVAVGGILTVVATTLSVTDALLFVGTVAAIAGGLGIIIAPSMVRVGKDFDEERQRRVRADERARISAHLHDSVLQTLTLIQRHNHDPHRTAQLARQQERELRSWLYKAGPAEPGTTRLGPALEAVAASAEDNHGVQVDVVVVGDTHDIIPAAIVDLVAATGEATNNAARHAKVDKVDIYAERSPTGIEVFVKDAGVGFTPSLVDSDRHGIRESIIGRMERAGGTANVVAEPGSGTEVELFLPLSESQIESDLSEKKTNDSSANNNPSNDNLPNDTLANRPGT